MKAAAGRRLARQEWARSFGEPIADDRGHHEIVLEEIRWSAGHVAWLRDRVADVEPDALIWGTTSEVERRSGEFPGIDITKAAKASAWLVLYGEERDRLLKMCKLASEMGIEERRITLAERLGSLITDLVGGVLAELDLTPEQWIKANGAVTRNLRTLAGALEGRP
ncbi:hypothetical protein ABGB08_02310 [Acrocarpospora sp. B8E8]